MQQMFILGRITTRIVCFITLELSCMNLLIHNDSINFSVVYVTLICDVSNNSYFIVFQTASGVPLLQNTPPTPPLSQELSLQPTLLQEYSPTKLLSRAAKQALGDSHTDLITTTSRQTKV